MDLPAALNLAVQIAAIAAQIIADDEAEDQEMMLAIRVAAEEVIHVMELEEDGLEDLDDLEASWTRVTVVRDDYHDMPDRVFKLHFRMEKDVFDALCQTLYDHLVEQGRIRRHRTPFRDIVLMVVWILATEDTFRSVALRFGVTPGTLYYFYSYIIEGLRELAPRFISWPSQEERIQIQQQFQQATGFPGIIGCIDGTHVSITAPVENAALYINRHHTHSINVQAVVDCNLLVRDIHVGEVGSMHYDRVFRRSPLGQKLMQGEGVGPEEHLVGDGGYTLNVFLWLQLLIPFPNNGHLTEEQKKFNKKPSQSRVRVKNAFARAKGKWRRLKYLHARNQAIVTDHIIASFVLHNFLIQHGAPLIRENELARPLNNNEVRQDERGNVEDNVGDDADEDQVLYMAKMMGLEKQAFIMQHVLRDIP